MIRFSEKYFFSDLEHFLDYKVSINKENKNELIFFVKYFFVSLIIGTEEDKEYDSFIEQTDGLLKAMSKYAVLNEAPKSLSDIKEVKREVLLLGEIKDSLTDYLLEANYVSEKKHTSKWLNDNHILDSLEFIVCHVYPTLRSSIREALTNSNDFESFKIRVRGELPFTTDRHLEYLYHHNNTELCSFEDFIFMFISNKKIVNKKGYLFSNKKTKEMLHLKEDIISLLDDEKHAEILSNFRDKVSVEQFYKAQLEGIEDVLSHLDFILSYLRESRRN